MGCSRGGWGVGGAQMPRMLVVCCPEGAPTKLALRAQSPALRYAVPKPVPAPAPQQHQLQCRELKLWQVTLLTLLVLFSGWHDFSRHPTQVWKPARSG